MAQQLVNKPQSQISDFFFFLSSIKPQAKTVKTEHIRKLLL